MATTSWLGARFFVAIIYIHSILLFLPQECRAVKTCSALSSEDREELLIGYKLLAHVLNQEAKLKYLQVVRTVNPFASSSAQDVNDIMTKIHQITSKRDAELTDLRKLQPDVSEDIVLGKVGVLIQDNAEAAGKREMMLPHGQFDARFLLLQAQGTRMISAMAKAAASFDCNSERLQWLRDLENEFNEIREEIVSSMNKCDFAATDLTLNQ